MDGQMSTVSERLAALSARERLLSRVDTLMAGQTSLLCERLAALGAREWPLPGVSAVMCLQTARTNAALAAYLTHMAASPGNNTTHMIAQVNPLKFTNLVYRATLN